MSKPLTSLKKAISWRIISILISIILGLTFFADTERVLWFTVTFHVVVTIIYYLHERAWSTFSEDA